MKEKEIKEENVVELLESEVNDDYSDDSLFNIYTICPDLYVTDVKAFDDADINNDKYDLSRSVCNAVLEFLRQRVINDGEVVEVDYNWDYHIKEMSEYLKSTDLMKKFVKAYRFYDKYGYFKCEIVICKL